MNYLRGLLCTLLLVPSIVAAQALAPDLSIDVVPSNPRPEQSTTLTARSYGSDLSQTTLSWTYNGSTVARGAGKTSIQVVAPKAGATGTITVTTSDGTTATAVLRPGSVDLLWEAADAYTPPFYKGKALLPVGGLLRITAIPATGTLTGQSFTWKRNTSAVDAQSGFGKASIIVRNDPLNPTERISATIGSGQFAMTNSIALAPFAPLALVYETTDGFINYARGFTDTIPFTNTGMVLRFEPYYFSVPRSVALDISSTIAVNKEPLVMSTPTEVALSRPETAGQSSLTVALTTVAYSLQHIEKTFTLLFN